MPTSRYARAPVLDFGRRYGTSRVVEVITRGIESGAIRYVERTLAGRERLDIIAAQELGDSRYWWMIAAASKIGWAPQVPVGTLLRIPNVDDVVALVG